MTTQPKRMLVHSFDGTDWRTTEYPSVRAMQRSLRKEGVHLDSNEVFHLGETSILKISKSHVLEIEEAVDHDGSLWFQGAAYMPVKAWAKAHGTTVKKARYAYHAGRLAGMSVGRRNYLYIRKDEHEEG